LLQKTNQDWWSVRKSSIEVGDSSVSGFVPANYVKEIEPKLIKKTVKKPVKVWEKQKVKRLAPPKPKKVNKRNSKRRLSIICDAESVEQRQKNINVSYEELLDMGKVRRQFLEDAIQLFRFNRECDGFETWMKEKENVILETTKQYQNQEQETNQKVITDPVEIIRKKFENLIADLSANRSRLDEIDHMADEYTANKAQHYSQAIKQRQNQIHNKWDKLNKLMQDLGKNVEGLKTVEFFNTTCNETVDWMVEKMDKIDHGEYGKDLRTVQALHR
jgi:spectrin beta